MNEVCDFARSSLTGDEFKLKMMSAGKAKQKMTNMLQKIVPALSEWTLLREFCQQLYFVCIDLRAEHSSYNTAAVLSTLRANMLPQKRAEHVVSSVWSALCTIAARLNASGGTISMLTFPYSVVQYFTEAAEDIAAHYLSSENEWMTSILESGSREWNLVAEGEEFFYNMPGFATDTYLKSKSKQPIDGIDREHWLVAHMMTTDIEQCTVYVYYRGRPVLSVELFVSDHCVMPMPHGSLQSQDNLWTTSLENVVASIWASHHVSRFATPHLPTFVKVVLPTKMNMSKVRAVVERDQNTRMDEFKRVIEVARSIGDDTWLSVPTPVTTRPAVYGMRPAHMAHVAAAYQQGNIVNWCVQHHFWDGIHELLRCYPAESLDLNQRNGAGYTPLHELLTAKDGFMELITALIKAGASCNIGTIDSRPKHTGLSVMQQLVEHCVRNNTNHTQWLDILKLALRTNKPNWQDDSPNAEGSQLPLCMVVHRLLEKDVSQAIATAKLLIQCAADLGTARAMLDEHRCKLLDAVVSGDHNRIIAEMKR